MTGRTMVAATQTAAHAPAHSTPFLSVEGLKKYFGGVKALDGVSFFLEQGEVHALVGENGAGKSTLIKILSGVFPYDHGAISLGGHKYSPQSPHEAKAHGVQVVHQEFNLLEHLSIAENISIEKLPRNRFGLLDRQELNSRARKALDAIGLTDIDVKAPVSSLGIAHRQLVEIARALQSESQILILDEPTATLTERKPSVSSNLSPGSRQTASLSFSCRITWMKFLRFATGSQSSGTVKHNRDRPDRRDHAGRYCPKNGRPPARRRNGP
jgi:ribose transport system ATP-binding protein